MINEGCKQTLSAQFLFAYIRYNRKIDKISENLAFCTQNDQNLQESHWFTFDLYRWPPKMPKIQAKLRKFKYQVPIQGQGLSWEKHGFYYIRSISILIS